MNRIVINKRTSPVLLPSAAPRFFCPILGHETSWMERNVYNPAAIVKDDRLHILFRADMQLDEQLDQFGHKRMVCRIGHASSEDGVHFEVTPEPVLFPMKDAYLPYEWWGGCQDLHIVTGEDGRYYMNYDGWSGVYDTQHEYGFCGGEIQDVLMCAESSDLVHWEKTGPALLPEYKPFYNHSRSGTVISEVVNGELVAKKLDGHYWMYMSHRGYLAKSEDLLHWRPVVTENGRPASLFPTYPKLTYCCCSCEAGAAAVWTPNGVFYFFNGLSASDHWSIGVARIDPTNLLRVVDISKEPVMIPTEPWEKQGHTHHPCVVCNTLVHFQDEWRLYYGGADHVIGMATLTDEGRKMLCL